MPYPSRPTLRPDPRFTGSPTGHRCAKRRAQLVAFVAEQYQAGLSIRQVGELVGRSQTAVRRALGEAGVPLRSPGAPRLKTDALE